MASLQEIKSVLKDNKARLYAKYGLSDMAIFGSYSRGQQTEASDIDILVDFQQPIGIQFVDLAEELETLLHHRIDLVSKKGIKPSYFQFIEKELSYV